MLKTDPCAVFSLAGRGNQAAVSGLAEVETTIESMQFRIHQWPVDTEALAQRGELQQRTLMQHTQAGALPLSTSIAPVAPLSITTNGLRFQKSISAYHSPNGLSCGAGSGNLAGCFKRLSSFAVQRRTVIFRKDPDERCS